MIEQILPVKIGFNNKNKMLTDNALQILKARYLHRDANGEVSESPDQLFKRVAKYIASAEEVNRNIWETRFYELMASLQFLPNSPTLMNAGLPNGQLSACFVLPIEDSLDEIFTTLKNAALIHQSGGGTGFDFSKLRPKDDQVSSSGGKSSGPIAFMKLYDAATEYVKQGGKRRGANMGIFHVDHPDILEFIIAKTNGNTLQNFNISVGITRDFMHALEKQEDWKLINPRTGKVQKIVKAAYIWNSIVKEAWKTGDPGLVFLDSINKNNPISKQGYLQCTNPCGEVPLLDFESCNLGSLNLTRVLIKEGAKTKIDWPKLETNIQIAMRFLDNVITVNHYLLPQIKKISTTNRKVGLGVMGWAELLLSLGIPYASEEAVNLGEQLMEFIKTKSHESSRDLAQERSVFPSWKESSYAPHKPMRNATCNSIAPTGTISVIADTSYSIEPLYALAYRRVGVLQDKTQTEINSVFLEKMKRLGLWNEKVKAEVLQSGSIQHMPSIPKEIKKLFETSLEIPWEYHLLHQRAFQKYTDNAVSKTINLPEKTTVKEISEIYKKAWEYGLKGITIYRNKSRTRQVLQKCNFNNTAEC
ncbi:adenosylcobalamin-dependent ribonucleoside-diphosphate reductase [Maribacter halichondriae]|uniref:adenosylcobalamin-dependent ribonucleoside-diphosphate reductase n=1 Tax=Maribacter halichondriae TaxID=2980554 RepID=UPI002358625A|nr:adenosylcobalamin-dependent ribonucleoside-diphosphate reductase [Maribacter sp. Hal144]